ncbi:MAG: hypothetical protein BEN18_01900 [Epulopiscium sp. Nuni2H_MBin001]|nr:MAG: hypothetical protein BEN18_01900 [Epulopiscium sp. Nuni2H_MBin001]
MKMTITVTDTLTGKVTSVEVTPEVKEIYEAGVRQELAQEKQAQRHNDMGEFDENILSDRIAPNALLELIINSCPPTQAQRAYMHWIEGLTITEMPAYKIVHVEQSACQLKK